VSQQGLPPGHSSRSPQAGGPRRSSRHAGPSRDEQDWDQEAWNQQPWDGDPVEWPSEPDLAGQGSTGPTSAGQGSASYSAGHARAGYPDADYGPATPPGADPAGPAGGPGSAPGHAGRSSRDRWVSSDPFRAADDDSEAPPWAGLSIAATRPGGTKLRPPDPQVAEQAPAPGRRTRRRGRAAAARLRKSRRRVFIWCGSAIVVAVVIAGVAALKGLHKPAPKSGFVTTLQAGEYRTVPSACRSVSTALLTESLQGQTRKITPASTSGATSQCSFSVDSKPVFRVLEVTIQAFQPSAVAAGNGSATASARDEFLLTQLQLAHPPKKSPLPAAQIAAVPQLAQGAFAGLQVIHSGHVTTDLVTVLARLHNVLVTVTLQAQAAGNGFGPVSAATVHNAAVDVARAVAARVAQEPAVKA
jgi:hypothetical protein